MRLISEVRNGLLVLYQQFARNPLPQCMSDAPSQEDYAAIVPSVKALYHEVRKLDGIAPIRAVVVIAAALKKAKLAHEMSRSCGKIPHLDMLMGRNTGIDFLDRGVVSKLEEILDTGRIPVFGWLSVSSEELDFMYRSALRLPLSMGHEDE